MNRKIIRTVGDGRCFFRSLVIGLDPVLATADRDAYGCIYEKKLKAIEENRADELRAQMVQFMKVNVTSYHSIGDGVLDADMPEHLQYKSIEARINAMATNTTMVGEMEIIATGKVLKRTIITEDIKGNVNNVTITE